VTNRVQKYGLEGLADRFPSSKNNTPVALEPFTDTLASKDA